MADLAAIVARDRLANAAHAENDRRALLVLLRETRDALDAHLTAVCGCMADRCRSCETGDPILARLAALDTEVPA